MVRSPLHRRTLLLRPIASRFMGAFTDNLQKQYKQHRWLFHIYDMHDNSCPLLLLRMEERYGRYVGRSPNGIRIWKSGKQ